MYMKRFVSGSDLLTSADALVMHWFVTSMGFMLYHASHTPDRYPQLIAT